MKVGDLVMLSTSGKKIKQNDLYVGGWGMIIKIDTHPDEALCFYPIVTQWFVGPKIYQASFKPYELRFFKKNKLFS